MRRNKLQRSWDAIDRVMQDEVVKGRAAQARAAEHSRLKEAVLEATMEGRKRQVWSAEMCCAVDALRAFEGEKNV